MAMRIASAGPSVPSQRQIKAVWGVEVRPEAVVVKAFDLLSFGIHDQRVAAHGLASLQSAFDRKADEQRAQAFSPPTESSR
jgi:hypothetical protein